MSTAGSELVQQFLGSAHVFASVVADIFEAELLREISQGKLTSSQLRFLQLVGLGEVHTVCDAAALLGESNTAASKMAEKLVRRHLLRRAAFKADRRSPRLELTEVGRRLLEAFETTRRQRILRVFSGFSQRELLRTAGTLDRVALGILQRTASAKDPCLHCSLYFGERSPLREFGRLTCFHHRELCRKRDRPAPRAGISTTGSG